MHCDGRGGLTFAIIFLFFLSYWLYHVGCSKLLPNHQSRRELQKVTFCNINYLLEFCAAPSKPPMPSIILEEEQCMDVNTNSRRGWIWVHFSNLAIHLSSSQPEEWLLPPRSLIKQERINNRCLRRGRLYLLEKRSSLGRKAKQSATVCN